MVDFVQTSSPFFSSSRPDVGCHYSCCFIVGVDTRFVDTRATIYIVWWSILPQRAQWSGCQVLCVCTGGSQLPNDADRHYFAPNFAQTAVLLCDLLLGAVGLYWHNAAQLLLGNHSLQTLKHHVKRLGFGFRRVVMIEVVN